MAPGLSVARETRTRIPEGACTSPAWLGHSVLPLGHPNNADDFERIAIIPMEERFADRIRFRPEFSRHSLVDDDGVLVLLVSRSKFPPAQQRNVQSLKEVRADAAPVCGRGFRPIRRRAGSDQKSAPVRFSAERQR